MSQIRKPDLVIGGQGYVRMDSLPIQQQESPQFIRSARTDNIHREDFSEKAIPRPTDNIIEKFDRRSFKNWSAPRELPEEWNGPHFLVRLIWAYKTLALTPAGKHARPKEFGTAWPQFSYKFEELVIQAGRDEEEIKADENKRNYVRPVVTGADITRMDQLFNTVYRLSHTSPATSSMIMAWAYARYRNISVDLVAARYNVSKKSLYEKISNYSNACAISMIEQKIPVS